MKIANSNFQANFGITIFMAARHETMTREFTFSQRNYEQQQDFGKVERNDDNHNGQIYTRPDI